MKKGKGYKKKKGIKKKKAKKVSSGISGGCTIKTDRTIWPAWMLLSVLYRRPDSHEDDVRSRKEDQDG